MWPTDETSVAAAKWITGILGGFAIAWKIFFRARRDLRDDGADGLIDRGQKAEITRLHESIAGEIAVRRQMETEAATLRRRISALEMEVARLQRGEPPVFRDEM